MEPDELKAAWQALDQRLSRHDRLNFALLREKNLEKARRRLRPLQWGQWLQFLLGLALIALGVACWSRNGDAPGLLAAGILVHAFGALTAAMAGIVLGLAAHIDYAAPVLEIQKKTARLLRLQTLNAGLCGLPWWIAWLPVTLALAGLDPQASQAIAPAWIWAGLAVGVLGMLGSWAVHLRRRRRPPPADAARGDGADGIRRSQRLLVEIAEFERE